MRRQLGWVQGVGPGTSQRLTPEVDVLPSPGDMKIGFSSLVCPTWDLPTIVTQASTLGFAGVELRGLRGELHLPLVPELAADPAGVRQLFADHKVELVCLGASAMLSAKDRKELAKQKASITEFLELASKLRCPYVRIFAGEVGRWDTARAVLARTAEALISLVPVAQRLGVTLLVENGGDFPSSSDLWFLVDAVEQSSIRCCWNQCSAMAVGERATNSIPRLGNKLRIVHICDAQFDEAGVLTQYKPLGEGQVECKRQIELLTGMAYDGYLMFEWPKLWVDSLPPPEAALPAAAKFLRAALDAKQSVLSAYKGDKNAPKFVSRGPVTAAG